MQKNSLYMQKLFVSLISNKFIILYIYIIYNLQRVRRERAFSRHCQHEQSGLYGHLGELVCESAHQIAIIAIMFGFFLCCFAYIIVLFISGPGCLFRSSWRALHAARSRRSAGCGGINCFRTAMITSFTPLVCSRAAAGRDSIHSA